MVAMKAAYWAVEKGVYLAERWVAQMVACLAATKVDPLVVLMVVQRVAV